MYSAVCESILPTWTLRIKYVAHMVMKHQGSLLQDCKYLLSAIDTQRSSRSMVASEQLMMTLLEPAVNSMSHEVKDDIAL